MRVATWNLERGGPMRAAAPAQRAVLDELGADVIALTEPPSTFADGPGVVCSAPLRIAAPGKNESWVAVLGSGVERVPLEIPYERTALAARAAVGAEAVIVYCSVLPWLAVTNHAKYLVRDGETSIAAFERVLNEQVDDVKTLRRQYGELVIWAGDFNLTLVGTTQGGSAARRVLLQSALDSLGYVAWNAAAAHASAGMCAVDLLCGPRDRAVRGTGRIDPVRNASLMSDHAGYWVDV